MTLFTLCISCTGHWRCTKHSVKINLSPRICAVPCCLHPTYIFPATPMSLVWHLMGPTSWWNHSSCCVSLVPLFVFHICLSFEAKFRFSAREKLSFKTEFRSVVWVFLCLHMLIMDGWWISFFFFFFKSCIGSGEGTAETGLLMLCQLCQGSSVLEIFKCSALSARGPPISQWKDRGSLPFSYHNFSVGCTWGHLSDRFRGTLPH